MRRKIINKAFWFYDEIYRANYVFVFGSEEYAIEYVKKNFDVDITFERVSGAKCFEVIGYGIIILMPSFDNSSRDISFLIHEIVHGSLFILNDRHVEFASNNSEAFTYHIEFVTRSIFEQLKK